MNVDQPGHRLWTAGRPGRKQKDLLERALEIEEQHFGEEHFEVAKTLSNLGNAYGKLGDPRKQKDLLERALKILMKNTSGEEHFEVAITLGNLGIAYGQLGEHNMKKDLLERSLKILEQHFGEDHFEVAKTLNNLAIAYFHLGDHNRSKNLLEQALKIFEQHYGEEHVEVAIVLVDLVQRLWKTWATTRSGRTSSNVLSRSMSDTSGGNMLRSRKTSTTWHVRTAPSVTAGTKPGF